MDVGGFDGVGGGHDGHYVCSNVIVFKLSSCKYVSSIMGDQT